MFVCVVFLFLNKWVLWSACVDAVLPNIGFGVPVYFSIFRGYVTLCVCVCVSGSVKRFASKTQWTRQMVMAHPNIYSSR